MPFITIQSLPFEEDIEGIAKKLCRIIGENTSFSEDRLLVRWDFSSPEAFVRHGEVVRDFHDLRYLLTVWLTCSLRNSTEDIQKLAVVINTTLADLLDFDPKRISVVIDAKEPGSIYVGQQFI